MARRRRERSPSAVKLKQPDRSGPSEQTLLDLAQQQGLFDKAKAKQDSIRAKTSAAGEGAEEPSEPLPPVVERLFETLLWTISLSTLHFTLDVLVQNQYAVEISWPKVTIRAAQAFLVFGLLFYALHAHSSNPTLLPGLPARHQPILRQAIFFVASTCAGCYLIHISNKYGYLAVMKQAPPVGCLWIWAVVELDLPWAVLSLVGASAFFWQGGYSIK